ncbi:hypothetical protein HD593_006341 [Nonomuraea rubra]|uniref:Tc toxin complex TcA C-terminal TcB-binding domain-containing protein n=1 Tax=Nonomuraea rubra TaxID=46180 RepID=A0A7X0NXP3_9ACTN|nr:hypothetical protein [Nonomuraea rubra]
MQTIATSSGSGLFETSLRDERSLPFEGHEPADRTARRLRQFDYDTVSDVILHLRYTAGEGGAQLCDKAVERVRDLAGAAEESGPVRLFSLRHDLPAGWRRRRRWPLCRACPGRDARRLV